MLTLEYLEQMIDNRIESFERKLKKFRDDFDKDPAYAFEWSMDAFRAAAGLRTIKHWRISIDEWKLARDAGTLSEGQPANNGEAVEFIKNNMMREVLRTSQFPPRSTSVTSNLIEQEKLAAISSLLNDIQQFG